MSGQMRVSRDQVEAVTADVRVRCGQLREAEEWFVHQIGNHADPNDGRAYQRTDRLSAVISRAARAVAAIQENLAEFELNAGLDVLAEDDVIASEFHGRVRS